MQPSPTKGGLKPLQFLLAYCVVGIATLSCAASSIKVVATTSIIGDFVQNIGGGAVDLTVLVGPDGDPHDYQPVPADSIRLADAQIVFENGLGLEPWLDKLATAAGSRAQRVPVSAGVAVRHFSRAGSGQGPPPLDDRDPHLWQDVRNAIAMVGNIRDTLIQTDPAHAADYRDRAGSYDQRLEALDAELVQQIQSIPADRRRIATSHDAFGYFAQRYGIEISRTMLTTGSTEASEPSARQLAEMIDSIKASGVRAVFLENIQNPRLISRIAAEAHVKVGLPLYSDALGKPGTAGDSYIKMMRYNASALAGALKP